MINVVVWNENFHERHDAGVARTYPSGIHEAIAEGLRGDPQLSVSTATLDDPDSGLAEDVLRRTDVLIIWAHLRHDLVQDKTATAVCQRVAAGMGLVALHSAAWSKIFRQLMGTSCAMAAWRHGAAESVWSVAPSHPVSRGVEQPIRYRDSEMYSEPFDIPSPYELVFISSYDGGEVLRSGCCFERGSGRVFYFAPGHESYPIYYEANTRAVMRNATYWAAHAEASACQ